MLLQLACQKILIEGTYDCRPNCFLLSTELFFAYFSYIVYYYIISNDEVRM